MDDAYAAVYRTTERLGVAKKTYWFISSDHGYNLGDFFGYFFDIVILFLILCILCDIVFDIMTLLWYYSCESLLRSLTPPHIT